ncbi:calcium/sodium antiporter [Terrisporobacter mayombei]|uniref:Inner membrane protein YrbG n=1 Tax=Terrisporobacter mayombei TaxID=1541 RepID=A0ABY9Q7T9_9FIRM|nr:calcium/sodium antiporter [Terrisporobacter mayombei]MCC3868748.1 calcium/sodium antiporter [Terrisporobacter mayombei]WMT83125.1 Inner membrane protein YrbG [Terrisporobacter mayombei]
MSFLLLIIGFFFLIKGANLFVEGASSIAKKFNVPAMVIGLTIVAMGTSAPEAAVSITSSLAGQNDMSVANVVGSNFFNILVVLGVSAIITKLPVQKGTIKKDAPFLLLVSSLLLIFGLNLNISRIEGLILLAVFAYFLIDTVKSAKKGGQETTNEAATTMDVEVARESSMSKTILLSIIGVVGIVLGGDMVVNSATDIATSFGMSANLVGLTIVAIGTSLPEFVTSVVAIKKGETEIAIGNIIGSNIFNILFVLGLATTISPITISTFALIDIIFMVAITVLLYFFMKKDNSLVKSQGIIFLVLYAAYMAYTIMR